MAAAIKSGRAKKIIISSAKKEVPAPIAELLRKDMPVEYWAPEKLNHKFADANHQSVACECSDLQLQTLDSVLGTQKHQLPVAVNNKPPLYLALSGITDPQNFGACIRSALAFSCQGLIFPGNNSATINAACVKASAGMVEFLPLIRVSNLARSLKQMQDSGYWVLAAEADAKETLAQADCKRPLVLLLGSEDKGLGRLLLELSDYQCRIDIDERVESLNVSTACAVLLSQIRQSQ